MKKFKSMLVLGVVVALAVSIYFWWEYQARFPSTDDAYIQANILTVSPQMGGKIATVAIHDNQYVHKGDLLFTLDDAALKAAVNAAQAQLDIAKQTVGAGADSVSAAQAQLASADAALTAAQQTFDRTEKLVKAGDMTKATLDTATAARDQAVAQKASAEAALMGAQKQLGGTGQDNASIRAAKANLDFAQINLDYTSIKSPVTGWVANATLLAGQNVSEGEPLFAIVEENSWWIDANFKETDLVRLRPGQPVSILIDMYPGIKLKGSVESIGSGSGAVFSLVPAQNATGNWVKVTQRFTARIKLDQDSYDPVFQLRAGASASVTVDTTANSDNQ